VVTDYSFRYRYFYLKGKPLFGVNILEIGTSNGTVTDFDGKYSLRVAEDATPEIFPYRI
jgi:hypothetical protein